MDTRSVSGGQKPVKTAIKAGLRSSWRGALLGIAISVAAVAAPAVGQEQGQLFATQEEGYGRLVLSFPGRDDLPPYRMRIDNGVLSLEFDDEVSIILPDVGNTMAPYLSVARIDPDGRGLRLGLRSSFNFNRTEAGEKLFIDLMPTSWQGMPPALPQDVVDELAERERLAAIEAERQRKAAEVAELAPQASVRIGRNATFVRVQFDWTIPTKAEYVQEGEASHIAFEWPVEIDMRDFAADLPPEIASVETSTTPDGAVVTLALAEGVTPRFYENNPRQFVLDVDIAGEGLPTFSGASLAGEHGATAHADAAHAQSTTEAGSEAEQVDAAFPHAVAETVTPFVSVLGSTVRVVFPFEQDTPAAVFRRGDTVWMVFDTVSGIEPPERSEALGALASDFAVMHAADTQIVRLDLSQDRLATLGSEGRAWVLSLGDIMLSPTEPIDLRRRRDFEGNFEIAADVVRPGRVHEFRDPLIGDELKVVTAYPPARGVTRTLDFVEFSALRSIHGLVIKPKAASLDLAIENDLAVLSTSGGLTVSAADGLRNLGDGVAQAMRGNFIDLGALEQNHFGAFNHHVGELLFQAADAQGADRDALRLDLAQYYVANRFALEAVGVLDVLSEDLQNKDLTRKLRMTRALADILAGRPAEALDILNAPSFSQEIDTLLWRTIARADSADFKGAILDAVEANSIVDSYPLWVRTMFRLASARAAVETGDWAVAERFIDAIDLAGLDPEQSSLYHLLSGRIDEGQGRATEAIDTYGQVIAADIRPTRAEAIYRTLRLLDEQGSLNLEKAATTLSAEAMLWRGTALEADMLTMLAKFYFRDGDYRQGFETVQQAVANYPESPPVNALRDEAQRMFGQLFLDGVADQLGPVDALGLYYDFRQLTPAGARGDEMIRNLARRLVRVDLLPQAAELLQYQLDNRLRGVARTQIAADLAIIYLADRKPQEALRVLNATRLPDIPESLQRQRRVLEARAMIDGGRDQLGLELLRDMDGEDATILRIDAHWRAKRYREASELLETLYADRSSGPPLTQPVRMGIIKAAVGFALDGDSFGLSRLRAKFGDAMVTTPEWPMFDLVTGQVEITSLEFKAVANQVSGVNGINAFLASYRDTYAGEGALAPLTASEPGSDVASAG